MSDSNLEEKNNLYFMNKNENNIELMTSVKIKQFVYKIYQYTKGDCKKYFKVKPDTEYIGYVDNNKFYVINLNDGEFDDDFKQIFNFINDEAIDKLVNGRFRDKKKTIVEFRKIHNFEYIKFWGCHELLDLANAKNKLNLLNESIKSRCDNYKLELNYVFQMETDTDITAYGGQLLSPATLLLCIYDSEKNCVASLVLSYHEGKIEISSKTRETHQRKKLNKLLRSVIIILSKIIFVNAISVNSNAINPISAYVMIKYFNAKIVNNGETKQDNIVEPSLETIKNLMSASEDGGLDLYVELTKENIIKANNIFNNLINGDISKDKITCGGRRRRKTRRKKSGRKLRRKKSGRKLRRKKSGRKTRRKKSIRHTKEKAKRNIIKL